MKNRIICLVLASLFIVSCEGVGKKSEQPQDWSSKMRSLSQSIQGLFPFVFSNNIVQVKEHKKELVERLKVFKEQTAYLPSHIGEEIMGKDPIVRYSVNKLRSASDQALEAVETGHYSYAQGVLKSSLSACFNCHTAQQIGPEDLPAKSWMSSSLTVSPSERADYFIATRQFDKAVAVLEEILSKKQSFYESPYELANAIHRYLALEVRIKKDPKKAIDTLTAFIENKNLPYYLKEESKQWIRSLKDWQREGVKEVSNVNAAKALVKKGDRLVSLNSGQGGLIEFLRASTILHSSLKQQISAAEKANRYHLLGQVYERLADLGVWNLSDAYYVACIDSSPKTKLAENCYSLLERDVIMGFSGSAGIMVPIQERERLAELKKKAFR